MAEIKKKVSVLTPTYNDSEMIEETLQSLIGQTYDCWEWIVINDGSTDNTEECIQKLIAKYEIGDKCRYISQDNADQLNALLRGLENASGDYIFILHSDDQLPFDTFFSDCVKIMEDNPQTDGLFGDLTIMNEASRVIGHQRVKEYSVNEKDPALMLLWLGRNIYSDFAFHRASVYRDAVKDNYLTWNMPLWIDLRNDGVKMLNYVSVPFPVLKYRVHAGNYINNELGRLNVINGELRTAVELMKHYSVPRYKFQYLVFRTMNKLMPGKEYRVHYEKRPTQNKYDVISFIVQKRYPDGGANNVFLSSLLSFYRQQSDREFELPKLDKGLNVYYGKDVRLFNRRLLDGTLEPFYQLFMNEMKKGFSSITVQDEEDRIKAENIAKFMCIGGVEVRVRG